MSFGVPCWVSQGLTSRSDFEGQPVQPLSPTRRQCSQGQTSGVGDEASLSGSGPPAQQGRWGEVCCLHPHAPRCTSCKCLVSLCSLRRWERKRDCPLSCGPSSPSPQPPPPAQKNHPLCKLSHAHCHRAAKARTTSSVETESRFTQVNTTCMLIAPETTANL